MKYVFLIIYVFGNPVVSVPLAPNTVEGLKYCQIVKVGTLKRMAKPTSNLGSVIWNDTGKKSKIHLKDIKIGCEPRNDHPDMDNMPFTKVD